jgi:hypothetical protein
MVSLPPKAAGVGNETARSLRGCRRQVDRQVQIRNDVIGLTARFNPFQSALAGSEIGRLG